MITYRAYDPSTVFTQQQRAELANTTQFYEYTSPSQYNFSELQKQIWDWQWIITTRKRWTLTEEDYTVRGISISDSIELTEALMDDWVKTTRSIAQLVELHDEGKEFIIDNPVDIEHIFNIIQEYTGYIGSTFSNRIHLLHRISALDPLAKPNEDQQKIINILEDVIKLQNLGNRLFPVMVSVNREHAAAVGGLLGFLIHEQDMVDGKLNFDPLAKYGLTKEDISAKENIDQSTGLYKAIDAQAVFDPYAFSKLQGVMHAR